MYFYVFKFTGKHFSQCKMHTNEFDECIKNGINGVRSYFTTGIFYSGQFYFIH